MKCSGSGHLEPDGESVLLVPGDAARSFIAVMVICVLSSGLAIRAVLAVDPAEAATPRTAAE